MTPASTLDEAFAAAVSRHDARIAALGLSIWVGSEPTFTDPCAQSPEWLTKALGGAKEQRAEALLCEFCQRLPGGLLLRSVGRQYPGEDRPRWNLGLYRRRNGEPVWPGPPDPMLAARASASLPRPGKTPPETSLQPTSVAGPPPWPLAWQRAAGWSPRWRSRNRSSDAC
jgi:uncharacterized protein (DUF2126 family)